ncbi:MAG: hypothetical protein IH830_08070 [Planctomycetes bacterium]|nr:hypothetical protein [Planctomycetota bacterium]
MVLAGNQFYTRQLATRRHAKESAALLIRSYHIPRLGAACLAVIGLSLPAGADVIDVSFDEPTLDRWMYPFSANPGFQWFASVFGALTDEGFDPNFDNRDGQMLIGFDTSLFVPPGLGPDAYTITSATVNLTVMTHESFAYDPTVDPYTSWLPRGDPDFEPDRDAGRPVELFGAAFRYGWSASTFPEDGPYCDGCSCFPPNSCKYQRSVYPTDSNPTCEDGDISNNIDERFDPLPFGIGSNDALMQGDPVPIDTELTFEIDVTDPCVQAYLQQALDEGMLDFVVASIFPAVKQQEGSFPKFYTKENPLVKVGRVSAARLDMTVEVDDTPGPLGDLDGDGIVGILDLLILLSQWGPCPPKEQCPADLNGDGSVGILDLLILLANWG